jgi:hypothetical protein
MADTTFHNVMITISAETPEAAYEALCDLFSNAVHTGTKVEYTTDTYSVEGSAELEDTSDLWPMTDEPRPEDL